MNARNCSYKMKVLIVVKRLEGSSHKNSISHSDEVHRLAAVTRMPSSPSLNVRTTKWRWFCIRFKGMPHDRKIYPPAEGM